MLFYRRFTQAVADTSIHKEWNINGDLEEWTPAELYFLTINHMSETILFSFVEKYGLHLTPGHPE